MEPTEAKPAAEAPQAPARVEKPRHEPRQESRQEPRQEQRPDHRSEHRSEHREKRGPRPQKPQGAQPEAVDKSELPDFLFRPVSVKKPVPQN